MTRINKWLSEMGVCSRKQADLAIARGEVLVNGQTAKLGMLIAADDQVYFQNRLIESKPDAVYLLYHKPVGVVCTHDLSVENNIEQALDFSERVFAVGRLDKESEGLMLLTNQGDSVNKIMRAENKHQKVYKVWVDKPIDQSFVEKMSAGVEILDTLTLPCGVIPLKDDCFQITLVQGLNLQIRRMCKALGYRVERLQRTHIMHLALDELPIGGYRHLTPQELQQLNQLLSSSSSVATSIAN